MSEIKTFQYDEFLDEDFTTPYLIDPILPRGGIGLIYGKGGHGKTQLVLSIIRALTGGSLLFGLWPTARSKVLFIQSDMPKGLFQERLERAAPDLPNRDLVKVSHIDPLDISLGSHRDTLRDVVQAEKPDLIVYDTLHKLHYLDENDSVSSRLVYSYWREAVGPSVTTFFLHHSRKDLFNPKAGKYIGSNEDFRGHTSWRDDSDLGIRVRKDRDSDSVTVLSFTRLRCEEQPSLVLEFDPETLLLKPDPSELKAEVLALRYLGNGGSKEDLVRYLNEEFGFTRRHGRRVREAVG